MANKNWTPQQFYDNVIGKSIDVDGAYGSQCVDLWNYFNVNMNGVYINCAPSGYAHSIYENRKNNGALKYFDDAGKDLSKAQRGDWVIWGVNSKSCPLSHVAMFWDFNNKTTSKFLGQNQGGKMYASVDVLYDEGVIGILRPKQYVAPLDDSKYLNISPEADYRTVYKESSLKTKLAEIKPKKFGGLTYKILGEYPNQVVKIKTSQFGEGYISAKPQYYCTVGNKPLYKNGNY